jgi:membrane fusion protein (multidrug efflux system)
VAIVKGLHEQDLVVTSGQLKLRNGAMVTIDNSVTPADNPNPNPPNE